MTVLIVASGAGPANVLTSSRDGSDIGPLVADCGARAAPASLLA